MKMLEMKIVHNDVVVQELSDWSKKGKIQGFTTLLVRRSYGFKNGPFKMDHLSGEKFYTVVYFDDKDRTKATQLRDELVQRNFFVVLNEINCL